MIQRWFNHLMLLLPDFATEPRRRGLASEEHRPRLPPGSDPAAEGEESDDYTSEQQTLLGVAVIH